ncbi:hypothetical protein GGR50DRAFT_540823 [Xylaria sp. CBS 124048]|nr:hypothetical protein GGR50DRAFT_540823 [Xylaria sp. CBS 124048]
MNLELIRFFGIWLLGIVLRKIFVWFLYRNGILPIVPETDGQSHPVLMSVYRHGRHLQSNVLRLPPGLQLFTPGPAVLQLHQALYACMVAAAYGVASIFSAAIVWQIYNRPITTWVDMLWAWVAMQALGIFLAFMMLRRACYESALVHTRQA